MEIWQTLYLILLSCCYKQSNNQFRYTIITIPGIFDSAKTFVSGMTHGSYPVFDYAHRMQLLLIPADMRIGSVIYRLRASDKDFDYPIHFDVIDSIGRSVIRVEDLPCTPTHTYCQANVYLTKRLEPGRVYDMILSIHDATGYETKVQATIRATPATSHFEDVFPYVPSLIVVPENTPLGSSLDFVLARRSTATNRQVELELWGSEKFRLYQTSGTRDLTNASIKLTGELDFEERTMYMLTIYALDPWTVERDDTRNIAGFQLAVVVTDVQDMPPVFTELPPVTTIPANTKIGEKVLQVHAQDGDRGEPRTVRYGLDSNQNPFVTFFNISEKTGELTLAKPLKELQAITKPGQPIMLTVIAEEVKMSLGEPAAEIATAPVAVLLERIARNTPPRFANSEYIGRISENAPQGTGLILDAGSSPLVEDINEGQNGVFSLLIEGDNGTFEVIPGVVTGRINFVIRVRNNKMLDYETRKRIEFQLIAKELSTAGGLNATCKVTVFIIDENDNWPVFSEARYEAVLPENATAQTRVVQVAATDKDTGLFGRIHYTAIYGYLNHSLAMDPSTGMILVVTNNHGFDREFAPEYRFTVEARDMEGVGNKVTVPLIIRILDVNDETPEFERQTYEFILQAGLKNFTSRAFVKAIDKDAEPPNNIVRYEISSGYGEDKFRLNEKTGELTIEGRLGRRFKQPSNNQQSQQHEIEITDEISHKSKKPIHPDVEVFDDPDDIKIKRKVRRQYTFEDEDPFSARDDEYILDSPIVLNIRAYDLGIPHRWQRAQVKIYPPEGNARSMTFIVSGHPKDLDRRTTEDLLGSVTGGRVVINEIRPHTGSEHGTDLTHTTEIKHKSVVTATVHYDRSSVVDVDQLTNRLSKNKTEAIVEATVKEFRSENRMLFWILIFLIILLLLLSLLLCLCCIWQGCCACPGVEVRRKHVISPKETTKFLIEERGERRVETKGVQAVNGVRHEAWSASSEDIRNNAERNVRFNRNVKQNGVSYENHQRNRVTVDVDERYHENTQKKSYQRHPTMLIEDVEQQQNYTEERFREDHHQRNQRGTPVRYYNESDHHRKPQGSPRYVRPIGTPYERRNISPQHNEQYLNEQGRENNVQPDSDSIRRHELDRGSGNPDEEDIANDRDQLFIRDGNAEILRLVTRPTVQSRPHTLVQDTGKQILMQRFIEDQRATDVPDHQEYLNPNLLPLADLPPPDFANPPQNIQDYMVRFLGYETQSLPGHVETSTQTEREAATQTDEPFYLRPPKRQARSDNELSDEEHPRRRRRPRALKTPIMEEAESGDRDSSTYTDNKSSLLRRRRAREKEEPSSGDELDETVRIRAESLNRLYHALKNLEPEDLPSSSNTYLKKPSFYQKDSTTTESSNKELEEPKKTGLQRSKYMDWYKNLSRKKKKGGKMGRNNRMEDDDSGIALSSSLLESKRGKLDKKSVFTIAYDEVHTNNIRPETNSSQKL